MNELTIATKYAEHLPKLAGWLTAMQSIFEDVESFEDLERQFLQGLGLSPHTYRSYMGAVRDFYIWSEGQHPFTITPGDIEAWYDSMMKRGLSRRTAALRIAGLKRFFRSIEEKVPFFESPFERMTKKLKKKLSRTPPGRAKKALSLGEWDRLKQYIKRDTTIRGLTTRAVILTLYAGALRSFELCSLTFANLELVDGVHHLVFIGKGSKAAEVEIAPAAVEAILEAHRARYGRDPRPEDPLFPSDRGSTMKRTTLWNRLQDVWRDVQAEGLITRDLEFSSHLFRRSCGSHMLKKKVDIVTIQHHLRHSSMSTTARFYLDTDMDLKPVFAGLMT